MKMFHVGRPFFSGNHELSFNLSVQLFNFCSRKKERRREKGESCGTSISDQRRAHSGPTLSRLVVGFRCRAHETTIFPQILSKKSYLHNVFLLSFRRMIGAMDRTISAGCLPSRTCCARSKVSGRLWRPTQISNGWALFRRPLRRNLHRRMCWKKKRNRLLSTGCPPPKRRPFSRRNLNTFCRQTATVTSWFSIELSR